MRGRVFQSRVFAPRALSGGGVVPATDRFTQPLILLGTSNVAMQLHGTSKQTIVALGTSKQILKLKGITP